MHKVILVFLVFFFAFCRSKPAFTVSKPIGWFRKDTIVQSGSRVIFMANLKSAEEITITDITCKDVRECKNFYMAELYKRCSSMKLQEGGESVIGDKLIQWVQWRAKYKFREDVIDQKSYFISNKPYYLIVSFANSPGKIPQMESTIKEVLNSIRIK